MKLFVDIIGWVGAVGVLAAYGMVSTGRVRSASYTYQLLNLVGAAALAVNTLYYMAYPSMALNVVWALIAVYAAGRLWRTRKDPVSSEP